MRATSNKSDQTLGNVGDKAQVGGEKMHTAKIVNNRPSSRDVEKGEVYKIEAPALLENLITREAEDHEQASHSKPLIVSEKIIVTLLVVCFVVVEAYFVGVSFRDWLDQHKHGNSTTVLMVSHDVELVPDILKVYKAGSDGDAQYEFTGDSEPYEDFEGGLSYKATRVFFDEVRHQLLPNEMDGTEGTVFEKETLYPEDTAFRESPSFGR